MAASAGPTPRGVKRAREDISDASFRSGGAGEAPMSNAAPRRHIQLIYSALLSHWIGRSVDEPGSRRSAEVQDGRILQTAERLEQLLHAAASANSALRYAEILKRLVGALQSHPVLTIGLQGGFTTPEALVETTVGNSIGHLLALAEAQGQLNLISPTDQAEADNCPSLAHNLARVRQLPALETQLPHILTFLQPADLASFGLATRLFLPIAWSDVIWHALLWRDLGPLQPKYYECKRGVLSCVRTGNSSFSSLQQPAINLSHLGISNSSRHKALYEHFRLLNNSGGAAAAGAAVAGTAPAHSINAPTNELSTVSRGAHPSPSSAAAKGGQLEPITECEVQRSIAGSGDEFSSSFFAVPDSYLRRRGREDSFRDVYKRAFAYVSHKKAVYDSAPKLACESCGRSTALRRMKSQMLRTVQYAECVVCRHVWTISVSDGGVKDIIRDMFGSQGIH